MIEEEQLSHDDLQTPLDQAKNPEPAETIEPDVDVRDAQTTPEPIPFHRISEIVPLVEGPEFDALVSDIAKQGLLVLITLFEDKILDGRNRYRACVEANVVPKFESYQGDDPLGLVVSRNVRRRHLDESQRALVAAKLETVKHGGNRKADQDANLHVDRSQAATMFNVSKRSIASAAKVLSAGAAELVRAVERAKISVSAAAKATELCAELQHQVAEKALAGDAKAARTIIAQAGASGTARAPKRAVAKARPEQIVTQLHELLVEAEEAFENMRYDVWMTVAPDGGSAKEQLMALAKRFRARLRELAESCSALSNPAEATADPPPVDDAPPVGQLH